MSKNNWPSWLASLILVLHNSNQASQLSAGSYLECWPVSQNLKKQKNTEHCCKLLIAEIIFLHALIDLGLAPEGETKQTLHYSVRVFSPSHVRWSRGNSEGSPRALFGASLKESMSSWHGVMQPSERVSNMKKNAGKHDLPKRSHPRLRMVCDRRRAASP